MSGARNVGPIETYLGELEGLRGFREHVTEVIGGAMEELGMHRDSSRGESMFQQFVREVQVRLEQGAGDTRRLDWLEAWIAHRGELLVKRWGHEQARYYGVTSSSWWREIDVDGYHALLVHNMSERGGQDETLREAIDAAVDAT